MGVPAGVEGDPCARPVAERVGNWVCAEQSPVMLVAAVQQPGFCNSSGCYTRRDDFRVTYESIKASWGYGDKVLGTHEHQVTWQLQGGQMHASPVRYRNSIATIEVVFSGQLLNTAPGAMGSPVDGTLSLYNAGNVSANAWRSWLPNGYISYDVNNWDQSQAIELSWKYPGYPGYWFAWVKSPSARSTDKVIYRFLSADQLPAEPFGGGHRL